MTNLYAIVGYCAASAMLVLMLMALAYSIVMPSPDRWSKNYFIIFFSLLTLCVSATFVSAILYGNPKYVEAERISCYIESVLISTLMPLPTILILHTCKEKLINSMLFHAVIALWIVYFIILEIGQFTNIFYIISSDGIFYRTSWFPLMVAPLVLIMLLNTASLIHRRRKLSKRYIIALLIYMIPLTIFVIIHAFIDIEMVLFLGVGICALSMYSLIVSDYIMQIIRQEREIAHQRASVMALQMRPHFIYNTMMSIYYLCKQDADKAQQVTLDFTSYLRKNFTAIASEELVPFKDELEHARAYLAVEQAQHEDMLYVDYDTLHTDFSVPSLTLQPLVENAVKHSLDPNGDPLHIYVRTQQTDKASAIIVENNGLDYQPSNDNEPHIALSNIRQRLRMMCKGELTIATREGGGTIVKVIIPNT